MNMSQVRGALFHTGQCAMLALLVTIPATADEVAWTYNTEGRSEPVKSVAVGTLSVEMDTCVRTESDSAIGLDVDSCFVMSADSAGINLLTMPPGGTFLYLR